jgi:hypothetical protein
MIKEMPPKACNEARKFGGPYWDEWKYSLLDFLKIERFPNSGTEDKLHKWWYLRMELSLDHITDEEFTKAYKSLFEDNKDDADSVLWRGVRYITEKLGKKKSDRAPLYRKGF